MNTEGSNAGNKEKEGLDHRPNACLTPLIHGSFLYRKQILKQGKRFIIYFISYTLNRRILLMLDFFPGFALVYLGVSQMENHATTQNFSQTCSAWHSWLKNSSSILIYIAYKHFISYYLSLSIAFNHSQRNNQTQIFHFYAKL